MQNFGKIGPKTGMKIHQFAEFFEKTYQHDLPDNCWVLSYLAVDKELQSKGIGRHLLSHVFTGTYRARQCLTLASDTCQQWPTTTAKTAPRSVLTDRALNSS